MSKVMRMGGVIPEGHLVYIVDCRGFQDPEKGSRWHLGMNAQNLYAIAHHKDFRRFIQVVKQRVNQWWNSDATSNLVIACYCRKGAHRSVAMAVLLHHLLKMGDPNYFLFPVRHLSSEAGVWATDYCGECHHCRRFSFQRTELRITQKMVSCAARYMNPCALYVFGT